MHFFLALAGGTVYICSYTPSITTVCPEYNAFYSKVSGLFLCAVYEADGSCHGRIVFSVVSPSSRVARIVLTKGMTSNLPKLMEVWPWQSSVSEFSAIA